MRNHFLHVFLCQSMQEKLPVAGSLYLVPCIQELLPVSNFIGKRTAFR